MSELATTAAVERRHYRREVPREHKQTLDTRMRWMWMQRFGTIQKIHQESPDLLDRTAATTIIQAIWGEDLNSIELMFRRLEGGAITDEETAERGPLRV